MKLGPRSAITFCRPAVTILPRANGPDAPTGISNPPRPPRPLPLPPPLVPRVDLSPRGRTEPSAAAAAAAAACSAWNFASRFSRSLGFICQSHQPSEKVKVRKLKPTLVSAAARLSVGISILMHRRELRLLPVMKKDCRAVP
jgi:hypothetical protein